MNSAEQQVRDQALLDAIAVCERVAREHRDFHVYAEQGIGANTCAVLISGLLGRPRPTPSRAPEAVSLNA